LTLVPSDGLPQNGCFVNETLVRAFGLKDPVGKSLPNATEKIAGIVHDFNMVSFRQEIPPVIITIGNGEYTKILVDYTGKPLPRVLHAVREEWEKIFPDHVFRYKLIENELERKHLEDVRLLQMVRSFAVACMLIACFGLFALAWGTIQNRTREVGIRKVFGATLSDILRLLSVDFMKWVVLAFVISSPIAYYLMDDWLRNFSYRESIGMGPFLKTGLLALVISWLMVGFHAVKAAILSPADTIREE
ncbi:MAG: hypothetical protein OEY56_14910, partial [Cyclobacteriaceae bacterium]|nr:hypothetical protein [Cyclobacteriaceae bacterium]